MADKGTHEQKLRFWYGLVLIEVALAVTCFGWLATRDSLRSTGAPALRPSNAKTLDSLCSLEQPLRYATLLECRAAFEDPYGTRPDPAAGRPVRQSTAGDSLTGAEHSPREALPASAATREVSPGDPEHDGGILGQILLPQFEYELRRIPPLGWAETIDSKVPPEYELVGRWFAPKHTAAPPELEDERREHVEAWKHASSYRHLFVHVFPAIEPAMRARWDAALAASEQEQVETGLSSIDSALITRWGDRVAWLEARMPYAIYRTDSTEYRIHGYTRESAEEGHTVYHLQIRIAPALGARASR